MSEASLGDQSLVAQAQADPTRFADLYENHLDRLFGYVLGRCGDRGMAEEITSETFLRALRALPRFEWQGIPYIGYLRRVADNLLKDAWQRAKREPTTGADLEQDHIDIPEEDDELLGLVGRLPADQRTVLTLRFAEDRSIAQVAEAMGRSEGAIKQLQHRAITTLRGWMTGIGEESQ